MPDPEKWLIFLSSNPQGEREFRTIELFHSAFTGTRRFVQDAVSRDLELEADAPRNPGATVTFFPISMRITEPAEDKSADPVLSVSMGAVGDEVQDEIDRMSGDDFNEPIELIYRKYHSGDLAGPVTRLLLTVGSLRFSDYRSVTFTGEDTDFTNKKAGTIYNTEEWPTLKGT